MLTTNNSQPGFIFADFGAAKTSSAQKANVKRLQSALVALGAVAGSAKLKVGVDGAIGPKTVAAVNWAFTNHIGPGQAPAQYRTGALTQAFVLANATTLAGLIETEVARRKGAKVTAKAITPSSTAAMPSAKSASKADVKRLQTALVTLGKVVGSSTLKAIKIDGAIGAKTVAGVNWAFKNHIGSGQAPAQYRTGNLTQAQVLGSIATIITLIETEIRRRGSAAPATSVAKQAELIKAIKTAPVPITKDLAKRLQRALADLGKVVGSATLTAVKADGAVGAKTVAAVNWAFTKHIGPGQAPAELRTGALDLNTVKGQAGVLAKYIEAEITRRRGSAPTTTKITAADAKAAAAIKVSKAAVKDLQNALVSLGKTAGSAPLKSVKVDGALGPATVTAVNWAFTKHIGSGQAPARYRTGALTLTDVKANISELIKLIFAETRRRGGGANIPTTTTVPLKTKGGKVVQAKYKGDGVYETTDEAGQTYDTPNPTDEAAPKAAPEPVSAEEEEAAAEEAPIKATVKPKASSASVPAAFPTEEDGSGTSVLIPGGGGDFLSEYKWPLIGGVAILTVGAVLLLRRKGGGDARAYAPTATRAPARTTQRRRAA